MGLKGAREGECQGAAIMTKLGDVLKVRSKRGGNFARHAKRSRREGWMIEWGVTGVVINIVGGHAIVKEFARVRSGLVVKQKVMLSSRVGYRMLMRE